ncbi:MAG TPA: class I SAM-dependent methyltransferase [Rhizomicrobium sp.]|nr:class I SAM-dependent methyltransferase [Rhizomicrobium sp.]
MTEYTLDTPQIAWWMPQIEDRGAAILLNGFITVPGGTSPDRYRITVDGQPFRNAGYMATQKPDAVTFRGLLNVAASFGDANEVVLRLVHMDTGKPVRAWDQFHLARPRGKLDMPLPPAKLTQRAIWTDPRTFEKWGYALKRKLEEAMKPYLPAPTTELRLLDWGCGAGRMARYLVHEWQYTGIDIDQEAISWCSENIPGGTFQLQSLEPNTGFPADAFDAAIGISIFTHLREKDQFAWLTELSRVVKPSGVVAVSVCGTTSLANAENEGPVAEILKSHGFCDTGAEATLKGVTADDTYYRNVYHTHDYIRRNWSRDFDVLDILPGFVGNMQDMVLLRPRR